MELPSHIILFEKALITAYLFLTDFKINYCLDEDFPTEEYKDEILSRYNSIEEVRYSIDNDIDLDFRTERFIKELQLPYEKQDKVFIAQTSELIAYDQALSLYMKNRKYLLENEAIQNCYDLAIVLNNISKNLVNCNKKVGKIISTGDLDLSKEINEMLETLEMDNLLMMQVRFKPMFISTILYEFTELIPIEIQIDPLEVIDVGSLIFSDYYNLTVNMPIGDMKVITGKL